ncbi:MAG: ABC transporter substrate-binding protein [Chloroflexota bacterium]
MHRPDTARRPGPARRALLALAALVLLALAASAPVPAQSPRTVSFMVFGDPAELAAYRALVDDFHAAQAEVRVEVREVADQTDYRQRLGADFAAGTVADVVFINYRRFAGFAARGLLTPLGERMRTSPVLDEAAFYPESLAAFRWRGALQCIPQNLSSLVVFYNRDLLRAAGLPDPAPDWTWDDFLATARALTADLDGDGRTDRHGLGIAPSMIRLAPFVWQNGAEIVDDPREPKRLGLDGTRAREAFTWFTELQTVHGVVPDPVAEVALPSEDRFLAGMVGMFLNSRRGVPTYRGAAAFDWDVAPLPQRIGPATVLHADAYCIPTVARDPDAAWAFVEHANSPAGQELVARTGRTVPSLRDVATSDAFLSPGLQPANSRAWLDAIPVTRALPILEGWVDIEELADAEIERAFRGEVGVDAAIEAMIERTRPFFAVGGEG